MPDLRIKNGGAWKKPNKVWVKNAGAWVEVKKVWIKSGGAWVQAWQNAFTFNQTLAANTNNYNLRAAAIAAGWDQVAPLIANITINSGVIVGSTSTGAWAFDTGASFPAGSTLELVNNGTIQGMGGYGGAGSSYNGDYSYYLAPSPGGAGATGGPALRAQHVISITNNGSILGGGGGGGGGGSVADYIGDKGGYTQNNVVNGSGGGGGRGANGGAGGAGGSGSGGLAGNPGGAGSSSAPGGGGSAGSFAGLTGGAGGSGGAAGSSGASGANASYSGGSSYYVLGSGGPGAAGGAAVNGNGYITWVATGTRLGAIS